LDARSDDIIPTPIVPLVLRPTLPVTQTLRSRRQAFETVQHLSWIPASRRRDQPNSNDGHNDFFIADHHSASISLTR